jgi:hypothetical protein
MPFPGFSNKLFNVITAISRIWMSLFVSADLLSSSGAAADKVPTEAVKIEITRIRNIISL